MCKNQKTYNLKNAKTIIVNKFQETIMSQIELEQKIVNLESQIKEIKNLLVKSNLNLPNFSSNTGQNYITSNPEILSSEPIIIGTRTSVRAIVELWRIGITPEEIVMTHLPYLTLAQVFSALSFYLDNQAEINEYIEKNRIPNELIHPSVKTVI